MKDLSRRDFLKAGLAGIALAGCQKPDTKIKPVAYLPKKVSYKLEDLCDTEVEQRNIKVNVYIEPSEVLWDYHKYKDKIFLNILDFFKRNKINCKIIPSDSQFTKFESPNEFGVEILNCKKKLNDRYFQLINEQNLVPEENPLLLNNRGYAVTRAGVSLIDGSWEEFRDWIRTGEITIPEIEKQFLEEYRGLVAKDYILKVNAGNIRHEIGHCMTLIHPKRFKPALTEVDYQGMPNLMSYATPNFKKGHSIGFVLTPLQQKLIHSFIAGNNNYKAFLDSKRDLGFYIENIAEANNLEISNY